MGGSGLGLAIVKDLPMLWIRRSACVAGNHAEGGAVFTLVSSSRSPPY